MNYGNLFYEMMKGREAESMNMNMSISSDLISGCSIYVKSNQTPEVKKVIWNNNACVVIWKDGTKTVVQCQEGDVWDKEVGLMAAFSKKLFGNDNTFNKVINKYCSDFFHEDERVQKALEKLNKCFYEAMEEDDEEGKKKKRLTKAIYLNGKFEVSFFNFVSYRLVLPQYASDFIKLANDCFDEYLQHFNLELSVVETKDNTFKIVLVEQKGEENEA